MLLISTIRIDDVSNILPILTNPIVDIGNYLLIVDINNELPISTIRIVNISYSTDIYNSNLSYQPLLYIHFLYRQFELLISAMHRILNCRFQLFKLLKFVINFLCQ